LTNFHVFMILRNFIKKSNFGCLKYYDYVFLMFLIVKWITYEELCNLFSTIFFRKHLWKKKNNNIFINSSKVKIFWIIINNYIMWRKCSYKHLVLVIELHQNTKISFFYNKYCECWQSLILFLNLHSFFYSKLTVECRSKDFFNYI
jgi:hypothetical protein